jgi:hypothetical protein
MPLARAQSSDNLPANPSRIFIGQDINAIDSYVEKLGHVPEGLATYTSIQRLEGLDSPSGNEGGVQYAQSLIEKYPHAELQMGLYMVGVLDDILTGRYDKNIRKLAEWFKKNSKTKFYLRIGYEFDNPENKYESSSYVKAYGHIVRLLRSFGVKNVAYVWHSYGAFVEGDIERWYPGDQYVDWVSLSFFSAYTKNDQQRIAKIAKKHGESTPRGIGIEQGKKAWNQWYLRLFEFARNNDVKIICYINCNWEEIPMFQGQGWGNARIEDNDFIKEKWLEEIVSRKPSK